MKKPGNKLFVANSAPVQVQYLCLCVPCLLIFLYLIGGATKTWLAYLYLLGFLAVCVPFCFTAWIQTQKSGTGYPCKLGLLMVAWFLITLTAKLLLKMPHHSVGLFLSIYLLAYPFAAVTNDGRCQIGLKILACTFLAAALMWVLYTLLLMADCLPPFLQDVVCWDGFRLRIILHPNNCSRVFMFAVAFCLFFSFQASHKWKKALYLAAAAVLFAALSLTNSRTAILMTCLLISATVFFLFLTGGRKYFVPGIVAAIAVLFSLSMMSQALFQWNTDRLMKILGPESYSAAQDAQQTDRSPDPIEPSSPLSPPTAAPELQDAGTSDVSMSGSTSQAASEEEYIINLNRQNSFLSDLPTLNSRTKIWNAVFERIRENPSILLWGINDTELIIDGNPVAHSHNSWLEVLLKLGLPGFLLSLVFTGQAILVCGFLLWHRKADMQKKLLSLLTLCNLAGSFLEPSLFCTIISWHFSDFFFFLSLGYMTQWRKQLLAETDAPDSSC